MMSIIAMMNYLTRWIDGRLQVQVSKHTKYVIKQDKLNSGRQKFI